MSYTTITGYSQGNSGWQFIASPLAESADPTEIDDMLPTANTYDLYRFDQSENAEWRNYEANNFNLENGQGYLYANAEDVNLIFKGEFNENDTETVSLAYDANASFAGWNLVGNPFPVSAYADKSYYTMNEDGTAIEPVAVSMGTAIPACTGVMVKAENTGESVTFSKTAPAGQPANQGVLQIAVAQNNTRGNSVQDKAIVSFSSGDRLEKFVFNKGNASLSIPQDGKDYAIANANKIGEMPLNFEAKENGEYTIIVSPENVELSYLHLIDNITGADVDLLALRQAQGPASYTFTAKTTDYESRFKLVFVANDTSTPSTGSGTSASDETFAFISNGNIIIDGGPSTPSTGSGTEGSGTLQIVDVMGRVIVQGDAINRVSTNGMTPGVYILRLINGNDVKTQKIVIE